MGGGGGVRAGRTRSSPPGPPGRPSPWCATCPTGSSTSPSAPPGSPRRAPNSAAPTAWPSCPTAASSWPGSGWSASSGRWPSPATAPTAPSTPPSAPAGSSAPTCRPVHDDGTAAVLYPGGRLVVAGTALDENNVDPGVFLVRYRRSTDETGPWRTAPALPDRPALTRRGVGLLAAAAGLLVAARLFGSVELAGLAAAAAGAVAVAAVLVGRAPMTYRGERWLAPSRVGARDAGRRPAAVHQHRAPGDDHGRRRRPRRRPGRCARAGASCRPSPPGRWPRPAYDLPTGRRGAVTVGPADRSASGTRSGSPSGGSRSAGPARLVVHPRIHPVLALPGSPTREARHGATHPARAARGDDFFALREYEVGDDLRRVHWRSTARHGDLMLRQDELRFGEVATVLLDTRASAHRGDSFERALEVAASVAAALVEDGRRLRFVTTGGFDMELAGARARGCRRGAGEAGGPPCSSTWPLVAPDAGGADAFALAVQSIRRHPSGPLAAVVADAAAGELAALGALRSRLGPRPDRPLRPGTVRKRAAPLRRSVGPFRWRARSSFPSPGHATDRCRRPWNQAVLSWRVGCGPSPRGLALAAVSAVAAAGCCPPLRRRRLGRAGLRRRRRRPRRRRPHPPVVGRAAVRRPRRRARCSCWPGASGATPPTGCPRRRPFRPSAGPLGRAPGGLAGGDRPGADHPGADPAGGGRAVDRHAPRPTAWPAAGGPGCWRCCPWPSSRSSSPPSAPAACGLRSRSPSPPPPPSTPPSTAPPAFPAGGPPAPGRPVPRRTAQRRGHRRRSAGRARHQGRRPALAVGAGRGGARAGGARGRAGGGRRPCLRGDARRVPGRAQPAGRHPAAAADRPPDGAVHRPGHRPGLLAAHRPRPVRRAAVVAVAAGAVPPRRPLPVAVPPGETGPCTRTSGSPPSTRRGSRPPTGRSGSRRPGARLDPETDSLVTKKGSRSVRAYRVESRRAAGRPGGSRRRPAAPPADRAGGPGPLPGAARRVPPGGAGTGRAVHGRRHHALRPGGGAGGQPAGRASSTTRPPRPAASADALDGTSCSRSRRGYCEQFAGAFAAMARAVGLPDPGGGRASPPAPTTRASGVWRVTTREAHAWPEVFLDGAGMDGVRAHARAGPARPRRSGPASPPSSGWRPPARPATGANRSSAGPGRSRRRRRSRRRPRRAEPAGWPAPSPPPHPVVAGRRRPRASWSCRRRPRPGGGTPAGGRRPPTPCWPPGGRSSTG